MKSLALVCISDLHVGCQLGLCRPEGARLDNGGRYRPTRYQRQVWDHWLDFWEWVHLVRRGRRFSIVINGDLLDGVHHNSSHQWSHNLEDQAQHAYEILVPLMGHKALDHLFIIRGTPVHSGESGVDEERLAKRLGAKPNSAGQSARYELWARMGSFIIHAAHHIGTTSSSQHEVSAVNSELTAMFTEAGRWEKRPPNIIVRSHRHRCSEIRLPSERCYAHAFVTAGWQLKTPFAYKVAGARVSTPQIGGSIICLGDEEPYTRHKVRDIGGGAHE